ncbi:MAG: hypothetical protein P1Q69_21495, partial [Candidatus Thorarchaeota archaeon]|nr:hypothetical protein [Candidatus Thorarchaeota archaeon]
RNSGFVPVENENEEARCSLCNELVLHERGTIYAVTVNEAKEILTDLLMTSRLETPKVGSSRGLGLKRRVLNIVESIIDNNRGRPAAISDVMRECTDAGIDLERASHFVSVLKQEGALIEENGRLTVNGEGVAR